MIKSAPEFQHIGRDMRKYKRIELYDKARITENEIVFLKVKVQGETMMVSKKAAISMAGAIMAAGLIGDEGVSAAGSGEAAEIQAEDEISPLYVPIGEGHTWTYVKTTYTSTGYIKIYSDKDSHWYYMKEVFYNNSGKYIKTVYDKFAI
ncbi:hypothetical protein ACQCVK_20385 [Rossellomorea vietnamensis]|uniref:Uncharacterized protein n=1 Tax=Rossellomorea aquimaris TaxID=189382 RepID=A0A5D4TMM1_9BACI|nr:hypothetical protein [Rossellomorea aquimaris]TYS76071.1 hypothetical protein FZC80_16075 [Rossellomorea aquimaris]